MNGNKKTLAAYIDSLQVKGQYTFTRADAMETLNLSADAFKLAALRLIKKKRLMRPKEGFYVIVPTEYSETGSTPVFWFIDSLMKFHQQPYYVGLLSAAALHGAAHQQPQVFQVITSKPLRTIYGMQFRIQFFTKKSILASHCQRIKTPTGYVQISLPELTALDLVRYNKSAGYLSHVTTILSELQETFDEKRFSEVLTEDIETPILQRLGYLLELTKAKQIFILLIKKCLKQHKPRFVPLCLSKKHKKNQQNRTWHLYINEKIEPDL